MSYRNFDGANKIHVNCPYCWEEYQNFEQIGNNIDYNHHLYNDFLIFPMESIPYPFFPTFFGKQQHIERIHCSECEREYTIVLLPFGLGKEIPLKKRRIKEKNTGLIKNKIVSVIDFLSSGTSHIEWLTNWKTFAFFNWLLFIVIFIELITNNWILFITFSLLFFSEISLIIMFSSFPKIFKDFYEIQKMPLLLHDNYIKTHHFKEFKTSFFDFERINSGNRREFFVIIFFSTVWGTFLYMSSVSIINSNNLLTLSVFILALFGVFLWVFYLGLFAYSISEIISDSFQYLMIVSSKIPFKINPWNDELQINLFKQLWIWTSISCLFVAITIPIILELGTVIKMFTDFISNKNADVFFMTFANITFIFYSILIAFLFLIIASILFYFNKNVEKRKKDLIKQIKKEILSIKSMKNPSNNDIFHGTLLLKKAERIKTISTFSSKQLFEIIAASIPFAVTFILNFLK